MTIFHIKKTPKIRIKKLEGYRFIIFTSCTNGDNTATNGKKKTKYLLSLKLTSSEAKVANHNAKEDEPFNGSRINKTTGINQMTLKIMIFFSNE